MKQELKYENLKAYMRGIELNNYQKADALIEFNNLIDRVEELEKDYQKMKDDRNSHQRVGIKLQQQNERLREALDESNKELIIIQGNIYQEIQKGNKQWDGVDKVLYQRIESNKQALNTDEEIDYESQDDPRTRGLNNG